MLPDDVVGSALVPPWKIAFHENVCTLVDRKRNISFWPFVGVPDGALTVRVPAVCVLA